MKVPRRLNRVRMKDNTLFPANLSYFGNRQNGTDLIVCIHHGDQTRIVAYRVLHLFGSDVCVVFNIKQINFKALFFQLFKSVKNRMMLKCSGYNMLFAFSFSYSRSGYYSLIIRFTPARREVYFFWGTAEHLGNILACLLQCAGVADYSTFTVNGVKTALRINSGAIPVLGTVDVTTY